jgi:predicted nucleic acid-binding protein
VTVISNTSPLNYLLLVEVIDVLPALFGKVLVATAVAEELARPRAPQVVRDWIAAPPEWLEIRAPLRDDPTPLGAGERGALALAAETQADLVLLDERRAARVAIERGHRVTGTLGVIKLAGYRGLLDLRLTIDALRSTNCRISPVLLDQTLDEYELHLRRGETES